MSALNQASPEVRVMDPAEAPAVSEMIYAAFRESVAAGYSEDGQREFFEYAAPERLVERQRQGNRIFVARIQEQLAGLIEVRPPSHIAQLFVDNRYQGQGIARALLDSAFPDADTAAGMTVTVNAAPDAVSTYGRLGFRIIAAEQARNGIRFVPMIRSYGPVFFPVSIGKLAAMTVGSLGIYPVSWIFWNWRFERNRTGEAISPFWRAFLGPLFLHSLFHRVKREADRAGVPARWSVGFTTLTVLLCWAAPLFRPSLVLMSLLAFLPLVPVQHTVNAINQRVAPTAPRNDRLTPANVALLLIGAALLLIIVWGMFVGVSDTPPGTISV